MKLKKNYDYGIFHTVKDMEEFESLCGDIKSKQECKLLFPDILAQPELSVNTRFIESVELVDAYHYIFDGQNWDFTLVKLTMVSGKEHLVISYDLNFEDFDLNGSNQ